jgi:hypothetical protein
VKLPLLFIIATNERGERIVRTCEGERRENEIFYNLIMHRESIVFSYALGNIVDVI